MNRGSPEEGVEVHGPRCPIAQALCILLLMSPFNFVAFSIVLSIVSFLYMFFITLVVMAVGGELDAMMFGVLLTSHLLALASVLLGMVVRTMRAHDGIEVWQCSVASGSFVVDVIQGTYLIVTWQADWMHRAFLISLSFLFLLDLSTVLSGHGLCARERARQRAGSHRPKPMSRIQVETLLFERADTDAGLGRSAYSEHPCHVCLDELQEGDQVGKLLCGHTFHAQCIQRWLQTGTGCPLRCPGACGQSPSEAEPALEAEIEPAGGRSQAAIVEMGRADVTVPGTPTSQDGREPPLGAAIEAPSTSPVDRALDRVVMTL